VRKDTLDWNGDSLATNFRSFFDAAVTAGLFLEEARTDLSCIVLERFGTVAIVDPEDAFHPLEIDRIVAAVGAGTNLFVAADWFHPEMISKVAFFDDNTQATWQAVTGYPSL
jgi:hypothetical protein